MKQRISENAQYNNRQEVLMEEQRVSTEVQKSVRGAIKNDRITFFTRLYTLLVLSFGIYQICGKRTLLNRSWKFIQNDVGNKKAFKKFDLYTLYDILKSIDELDSGLYVQLQYWTERASSGTYQSFEDKFLRVFFSRFRYTARRGNNFITKLLDKYVMGKMSLKGITCILMNNYARQNLYTYCSEIIAMSDNTRASVLPVIKNFKHFNISGEQDIDRICNQNYDFF